MELDKVAERAGGESGKARRTLTAIREYLPADEVIRILEESGGWDYKDQKDEYRLRDAAMISVTYLGALRISEVLRIRNDQFYMNPEKHRLEIRGILLSKRRKQGQERLQKYREAWLPVAYSQDSTTPRTQLTEIVQEWRKRVGGPDRLFPFGRKWAWRIVKARTGLWNHYFRALGENFLYDGWSYDMLGLSDYVKVDPRTLGLYIKGSYRKHESV